MFSPGRYVSDPTAGIDNSKDLPPAIIQKRSRNRKKVSVPTATILLGGMIFENDRCITFEIRICHCVIKQFNRYTK